MTELAPLSDRNVGWLRYLHRKATTPDSWDREDHPHEHWDNISEAPMLCYHRFDLIDSTYAVALMADRTPAWREVYERILDELIFRHTGWWAAEDWLTQIGDDPDRGDYPDHYRMLIPPAHWGNYNVPGWTANGIEPWGLQWDPIGADGNLFFKGFFLVMLGLHRRVTGNARWDAPFDIVRDGEHTFTWWHTKIAEHLAEQWRAHPEGCHCENTKIWPYCLAGAGFGLQLADLTLGTNTHDAFDTWWQHARSDYLHLDGDELPTAVTFYYDPIIDEHLVVPAMMGSIPAIYLAPQVPDEARKLWDAARSQLGMLEVTGPSGDDGPALHRAGADAGPQLGGHRPRRRAPDRDRRALPADLGPRARRDDLGLRARRAAPARPVQRHHGRRRGHDRRRMVAPRQRADRRPVRRAHRVRRRLPDRRPHPSRMGRVPHASST